MKSSTVPCPKSEDFPTGKFRAQPVNRLEHPRPLAFPWCGLWAWLLLANIAAAQSYSINWFKVSGGGGMNSTGSVYAISGTIGQHDAGGPMTGGSYSMAGGFWALIAPVQTPGAPTLYISSGTNSVTVYWQVAGSWSLQQNSSANMPSGWSASSGVTNRNGTNYLTLIKPSGKMFYRLMEP
jgi:hypothetical protein